MATEVDRFQSIIAKISEALDADLYLFSNSVYDDQADRFIDVVRAVQTKRTNAGLIFCTHGGNADAAYQISRCLKRNYKKVILYVFGKCKSAGTLVAVAANEIVMSEFGQFGPLDVQLADKDELYGQTPALDVSQSVATLSDSAFNCFIDHFLKLEPGRSMSTKTACEIAKALALGIVEPIASQIDPLLLGRVDRSMKIAEAYITRLSPTFAGAKQLIGGYPSHGFVIDFEEAKLLFQNVREPSPDERELEDLLRKWTKVPKQDNWIGLLSKEPEIPNETVNQNGDDQKGEQTAESAPASGSDGAHPTGHAARKEPARSAN